MKKYNNPTSFLDLLFNCLVGFIFLFVISFLLIAPPVDDQQKKPKAEFLVTLTWDSESDDDVDIWMRNPAGDLMYFREKNIGLMHLDRDDIGKQRDMVLVNGEYITQYVNQEIATIRGTIPGKWIINLHMYAKRQAEPANINVRVDKLNPKFHTVTDNSYTMAEKGEEVTVIRMEMTSKGKITRQDNTFCPIAAQKLIETGSGE